MKKQTADNLFVAGLLVTQTIAVIFYAIYFEHVLNFAEKAKFIDENFFRYTMFQDVHIMIYVGFGFLLTFVHRYRLSALSMCFWVAALTVQYYFLFNGLWDGVFKHWENIYVLPDKLILGEVSAGATLIALCAIIGKTNNLQYLVITIVGVFLYTLNEAIVIIVLGCRDVGGSMIIHAFGAFYGIGITWMLDYKFSKNNKNLSSTQSSFTSAMIGTLFLWCFWPSFNAALASTQVEVFMAVLNTYFAIIGSCIGAYCISAFLHKGKINMDQILNATLAGGVVMGAGADLLHKGYIAYIVGFLVGILSALLFSYSPIFLRKIGIYDVAGVFNLHGIPGMIGGLISAIFRQVYIDDRGAVQVAGTFISVGIALVGGLIVGVSIRWLGYYHFENEFFNDIETVYLEDEIKEKLAHYAEGEKQPGMPLVSARGESKVLNTDNKQIAFGVDSHFEPNHGI
jgi:ammonium transporter Rh